MTRTKKFDRKSILNRNRVRRIRLKKELLSDQIQQIHEFQESVLGSNNDDNNSISLRKNLRLWASNHRITSRAINDLLNILNQSGKFCVIMR